jgi:hypothetical protein
MKTVYGLLLVILLVNAGQAVADVRSKAAQEAAEFVLQKFGRQVVREGAETLARKIETYTAKHGDGFLKAIRQCGPRTFHLVEEAGAHSNQVVRILAEHGEKGATWIVTRPKGMQLFLKHGEEAAAALVRHPGVAEPVIEHLGQPAVRALQATGSQASRRLGMMVEDGTLAKIGRSEEVLAVIGIYGDKAMSFVWNHKGALATTAMLAAFLSDPEPFITGARDITTVVVKPIAEVPSVVAREAAGDVARNTNWTLVFSVGVLVAAGLILARGWLKWV